MLLEAVKNTLFSWGGGGEGRIEPFYDYFILEM